MGEGRARCLAVRAPGSRPVARLTRQLEAGPGAVIGAGAAGCPGQRRQPCRCSGRETYAMRYTGPVKAVAAAMRAYSGRGCAERVAQEFGDHSETAVARMRWAREVVGEVLAASLPARDGRRRRRHYAVPACADGGWSADEAHPYRRAEDPA